jgi:hypothetical protein
MEKRDLEERNKIHNMLRDHYYAMCEYYETDSYKLKFLMESKANGIATILLECYKSTGLEALRSDLDIKDDYAYDRWKFVTNVLDSFEQAVKKTVDLKKLNHLLYNDYIHSYLS